jgi:hypothetical protein
MANARLITSNTYSTVPLSPSGEYLARLPNPRDAHGNALNAIAANVRLRYVHESGTPLASR